MVNWTRHILEASSDAATCAWHMGDLTFQAYPANVFKPSKGGSCGCRGSVAEEPLQASSIFYIRACSECRITCTVDRLLAV